MFFPIIGDRLVKGDVFVLGYIVRFTHPKWLGAIKVIPFMSHFFDFLSFLLAFGFIFLNILYFRLILIFVFVVLFIVSYFLLRCFLRVEFDRESNKFRVLLYKVCHTFASTLGLSSSP